MDEPEELAPFDGGGSVSMYGALGAVLIRNGIAVESFDLENRPIDYSPLARLTRALRARFAAWRTK
jgi:hypothetical protein